MWLVVTARSELPLSSAYVSLGDLNVYSIENQGRHHLGRGSALGLPSLVTIDLTITDTSYSQTI